MRELSSIDVICQIPYQMWMLWLVYCWLNSFIYKAFDVLSVWRVTFLFKFMFHYTSFCHLVLPSSVVHFSRLFGYLTNISFARTNAIPHTVSVSKIGPNKMKALWIFLERSVSSSKTNNWIRFNSSSYSNSICSVYAKYILLFWWCFFTSSSLFVIPNIVRHKAKLSSVCNWMCLRGCRSSNGHGFVTHTRIAVTVSREMEEKKAEMRT